jgi:hypothetical protein
MSNVTETLQTWFTNLPRDQQEEVIQFLYDGKVLFRKGSYYGPMPGLVTKGLHCGPAPQSISLNRNLTTKCPTCGRAL